MRILKHGRCFLKRILPEVYMGKCPYCGCEFEPTKENECYQKKVGDHSLVNQSTCPECGMEHVNLKSEYEYEVKV